MSGIWQRTLSAFRCKMLRYIKTHILDTVNELISEFR
jgi:hypothetical protein